METGQDRIPARRRRNAAARGARLDAAKGATGGKYLPGGRTVRQLAQGDAALCRVPGR